MTEKEYKPHQFKPGNPGGPGRKKGSKNKLAEDFISDVQAEWEAHGAESIARMREEDNSGFVKVVAGLLPKDIRVGKLDDLSISELEHRARALGASLGLLGDAASDRAEEGPQQTH